MQVLHSPRQVQAWADEARRAGRRIGLVPTMGALHRGHLSLVEAARRHCDAVVLSIFVNPTQFGPQEDLARYPRPLEADLAACREAGVELAWTPSVEDLYPEGAQTWVEVSELSRPLCGRSRPGHFRGVTTVVTKLFLAAKPHVAVFGEKDFQQLAVLRRMTRDLGFDVEVLGAPTVREPDGLALSSRNLLLDAEARRQAVVLVRALDAAEGEVAAGSCSAEAVLARVREEIGKAPRAEIDYAELRDPDSLETVAGPLRGPTLLALAVHFRAGSGTGARRVRLIDNRVLGTQPSQEAS